MSRPATRDFPSSSTSPCRFKRAPLTAVLGGNGAGKSTLLKTILGDVRTTSGHILLAGQPITRWSAHQRVAAGISYSPEGRRVFPTLTVKENLVAGSYGVRPHDIGEQLRFVYDLFPLVEERQHQQAGSLSGGEQQMLAIGRALMPRPWLLMVEELSLGLAPIIVAHLYSSLRQLCQSGLAVLVSEQFQRFEHQHCDHWAVLERGTILATGTQTDAYLIATGLHQP